MMEAALQSMWSWKCFPSRPEAFHGMVPVLVREPDRKAAYLLMGQSESALRIVGPPHQLSPTKLFKGLMLSSAGMTTSVNRRLVHWVGFGGWFRSELYPSAM